jgi:hypothetical protein
MLHSKPRLSNSRIRRVVIFDFFSSRGAICIANPISQLQVFAAVKRNVAVPVDFAIVGKFTETVFPGCTGALPFETYAFQFLNSEDGHRRCHSFPVLPILFPLV